MNSLISRYKQIRKKSIVNKSYIGKYAFIGMGNHSIHNLYPIIDYLKIPIKYIVSKTENTKKLIDNNYPSVKATTDYEEVLNDPDITGIFISASPDSHYHLTKMALSHNKHVFVEKPVCLSQSDLRSLIELSEKTKADCVVGMHKRYSSCTTALNRSIKRKEIISYNYRFGVGAYPEGDAIWDIFIHPIDYVTYIFGNAEIISFVQTEKSNGSYSIFLQLIHSNVIGTIEMSTAYSWDQPIEELIVNTKDGIYEMTNHQSLTFTRKPQVICSIPTEKIFLSSTQKQILFNGNSFLPIAQYNQLVVQGYFPEIYTFINICEKKSKSNQSTLKSLINTYRLLELIQQSVVK